MDLACHSLVCCTVHQGLWSVAVKRLNGLEICSISMHQHSAGAWNIFPKGGPTCMRQVVNPRHQTPQGQSVAKPETPLQNIQVIEPVEMTINITSSSWPQGGLSPCGPQGAWTMWPVPLTPDNSLFILLHAPSAPPMTVVNHWPVAEIALPSTFSG